MIDIYGRVQKSNLACQLVCDEKISQHHLRFSDDIIPSIHHNSSGSASQKRASNIIVVSRILNRSRIIVKCTTSF
jgi:hypothetical protein